MRYKKTLDIKIKFFLGFFLIFFSNANTFPQIAAPEKSRIIEFGASLDKYKKKKNVKSEIAKRNNAADDETIRVKTDLMVSDVLVVDQKDNAVLGLKQEDFAIIEDGVQQKVELFAFGENASLPRSIVLVIDYSGNLPSYNLNSLVSAQLLVEKLGAQDKMAIVTDGVTLLTDFTNNKALLKNELEKLKKFRFLSSDGRRGDQYGALLAVLNEMFDAQTVRPIVIFQTAGSELLLLKPIDEALAKRYREREFSFGDVREAVEKSRATIYSVIPELPLIDISAEEKELNIKKMLKITSKTVWDGKKYSEDFIEENLRWHTKEMPANQEALIEISKISGGYADFLINADAAEPLYSKIFKVINNRYVVGYYPANQMPDGKRRSVKIEVRDHPEYKIIARKTYFAPEAEN